MPIQLEWNIWTGWPGNVESSFRRRISRYTRNGRPFKIGITVDPEKRKGAYDGSYDRMVVLYATSSVKNTRDFERRLIAYYRDSADNKTRGGEGRPSDPPYYLYVVTNW